MAGSYPIPEDEKARIEALQAYGILDTPEEQEFDDVATLAAAICDVPIALVSLVDEDRQWFKSRVGLDHTETSRSVSFCAHAIVGRELMEVEDATVDERFRANPLVTQDPNIRFYAGVPLVPDGEHALGTLCVIDRRPKALTASQRSALESLARQTSALIELRRANRELARISAQKNAFLRIVGHDLRTPLNFILGAATLLEDMVEPHVPAPEDAISLINELPGRARYMSNLINTYLDVQAIEDGGVRLRRRMIDIVALAREVLETTKRDVGTRDVVLELDASSPSISFQADRGRVRQILENLVGNAVKFTEQGTVVVRIREEEDDILVRVIDSGPGMSESDRDKLFIPYAELSTTAVGGQESRGLGLSICRYLVELHDGTIEASNHPDGGAAFTVRLPREPGTPSKG